MSEQHPVIWLQPWCAGCERHCNSGEGRLWCQDDVWGKCDDCEERASKYVLASPTPPAPVVTEEIAAERKRQIAKGYDAAHDDAHTDRSIAIAAASYAIAGAQKSPVGVVLWPWHIDSFKPDGSRHNLIVAAALCIAEIERLDRAALTAALSRSGQAQAAAMRQSEKP